MVLSQINEIERVKHVTMSVSGEKDSSYIKDRPYGGGLGEGGSERERENTTRCAVVDCI